MCVLYACVVYEYMSMYVQCSVYSIVVCVSMYVCINDVYSIVVCVSMYVCINDVYMCMCMCMCV